VLGFQTKNRFLKRAVIVGLCSLPLFPYRIGSYNKAKDSSFSFVSPDGSAPSNTVSTFRFHFDEENAFFPKKRKDKGITNELILEFSYLVTINIAKLIKTDIRLNINSIYFLFI